MTFGGEQFVDVVELAEVAGTLLQLDETAFFLRSFFVVPAGFLPEGFCAGAGDDGWAVVLGEDWVESCGVPGLFAGGGTGADCCLAASGNAGSTQKITMRRIAPRVIRTFHDLTPTQPILIFQLRPGAKTSGFYFTPLPSADSMNCPTN
jgi:hypothetical protein